MAGMRDYTDDELALVRKSFSGRYALRDRCFFEMALQMGLRVSEMLSLTVGQVYQYGKVVEEVSIERKHMKGGKAGKPAAARFPSSRRHTPISWPGWYAWPPCCTCRTPRPSILQHRCSSLVCATKMGAGGRLLGKPPGAS